MMPEEVKLDDVDEWTWKKEKKDKKGKPKGNATKGHNKIIEDLSKKYYDTRDKVKNVKLEKDRKKQEEFEKKKQQKQEEAEKEAQKQTKKAQKREKQ